MPDSPKVTFIICTYNRAHYLDDTLRSLIRSDYPPASFEILVVDNNSTDRTPEVVDAYDSANNVKSPIIRYVKEVNQGLSHARNKGIKEAHAPYVVFVDDDVRASNYYVSSWMSFFKNHSDVQAAGGRIHVQFDDPRPEWMSHFLLPLIGRHDLGDSIQEYGRLNYPFGGNMGFHKDVFNRHGVFDTSLGRKGTQLKASEEKEFFQRLKKSGISLYYLPDALLYHRVNKQRLTKEYIRRQAIGLGQSMALQLRQEPSSRKITQGAMEFGKLVATAGLFIPYTLILQAPKAVMLVKFRKWIAEGYLSVSKKG